MRLPSQYVWDLMARHWMQKHLNTIEEDAALKTSRQTLYYASLSVCLTFIPNFELLFKIPNILNKEHSWMEFSSFFFFASKLFYQLSTSRNNFVLNLTLQGGLLSQQFRVEYWKRGRLAWSHPYSPHCHYVGHLQDQPHSSKVALSNCNGLVRLKRPN